MAEKTPTSDADLELRTLRARAYGPHPDIADDPVALARLTELETARRRLAAPAMPERAETAAAPGVPAAVPTGVAAPAAEGDAERSAAPAGEPASSVRPWVARALAVGLGAAIGGVAAAFLLSGPRPDAILRPTGDAADSALIALLASEGQEYSLDRGELRGASEMEIDLSTLRGFDTYQDIELWSARNVFDAPCLIAVRRARGDVVDRLCVPSGVDLYVDTTGHGSLAPGESVRFLLRGDIVEVRRLTPEEVP